MMREKRRRRGRRKRGKEGEEGKRREAGCIRQCVEGEEEVKEGAMNMFIWCLCEGSS